MDEWATETLEDLEMENRGLRCVVFVLLKKLGGDVTVTALERESVNWDDILHEVWDPVTRSWHAWTDEDMEDPTEGGRRCADGCGPGPCEFPDCMPKPGQNWTHPYEPGHSGMACVRMVLRDGYGDACGQPYTDPVHSPFSRPEGFGA